MSLAAGTERRLLRWQLVTSRWDPCSTPPTAMPAEVPHTRRVSVQEIRGERVVLDHEVARLFGVETISFAWKLCVY